MTLPQDLCRGTKILAGDGNPIEVTKVEGQKANKLLELKRLGWVSEFSEFLDGRG